MPTANCRLTVMKPSRPRRLLLVAGLAVCGLASAAAALAGPGDNVWSALGSGIAADGGEVRALALSGSNVYAAGSFLNAGGNPDADYVAQWTGAAWNALGSIPMDAEVNALAVAGTSLYAGGGFADAGDLATADYIARWDGSQWLALGATPMTGTTPVVAALAYDGATGKLWVGGDFLDAGGVANADNLAVWNGSAWSAPTGTPLNGPIYALAVTGTNVYVGGNFTNAGGLADADFLARWDGSQWLALGATPLAGPVRALAVSGTDVYVGGSFADAGGLANADNVARWDSAGGAWNALGAGVNGEVRAVAGLGASDVFVGGSFTAAGDNTLAQRVARWNGVGWMALNPTANNTVAALAVTGQQVYVGGRFTDAGGLTAADRIALWTALATNPANTAPAAVDDAVSLYEDNAKSIAVLGNDSDPDGDGLNLIGFSSPVSGSLYTSDGVNAVYTPPANFVGLTTFSYTAQDTGALTDTALVSVTVLPVNDSPSLSLGADQFINEDNGAPQSVSNWVSNPSPGPADEVAAGQTVSCSLAYSNPSLFATPPSVGANCTSALTYQIATPDLFGIAVITVTVVDSGDTANGGANTRVYPAYIVVNAVNDAPSFTKGPDQAVLEDAGTQTVAGWATNLARGPANEAGQALSFVVTNTLPALFSTQPAVAADGTLTYTPAANANGSASVSVTVKDNGGTLYGGDDTGNAETFTITVTAVNDMPTFSKGANQAVNEDAGTQTVAGWATAISAGAADEGGQALTFTATNTNTALFEAQPAVAANGTLTYKPAANQFGNAVVSVRLSDNGGTANGGVDTSPTQTFTITVNSVNDAPSFTKGGNQTVNEDAGTQTVTGWATAISPGPSNESSQTVTFTVSTNNTGLFSTLPAVASNGTLTYRSGSNLSGTAAVTVTATDNGGTANGGINVSGPQTFSITVTAVNDAPVNTVPPGQTTMQGQPLTFSSANGNAISVSDVDANSSPLSVTVAISGANLGTLSLGGTAGLTFSAGDGSADASMTFTGSQSAIRTALNGTVFAPDPGFQDGLVTIRLVTNDQGASGSGGAKSDTDTFQVDVGAINDAPEVRLPAGPLTLSEDTVLVFTGAAGNALSLDDRDAAAGAISVTVTATHGVFSLNSVAGLTFLTGDGAGDPVVVFTGTLANANAALDGLAFTPAADYHGPAVIALAVDDQGSTGTGPAPDFTPFYPLGDTGSVDLTITPVNDAPSFSKGADLSVYREDGPQVFSGWATAISPGPADEAGQALAFTLSVDVPALFTVPPALDPATGTLTFTPAEDQQGTATIQVSLSDDGGTADGGADTSAPQTFTLTTSKRPIYYVFAPIARR